jgi:hypothetical protein
MYRQTLRDWVHFLLSQAYNPQRLLIVRLLRGAKFGVEVSVNSALITIAMN